jgi:hypothetical protein
MVAEEHLSAARMGVLASITLAWCEIQRRRGADRARLWVRQNCSASAPASSSLPPRSPFRRRQESGAAAAAAQASIRDVATALSRWLRAKLPEGDDAVKSSSQS